jgi:hypothetical protein
VVPANENLKLTGRKDHSNLPLTRSFRNGAVAPFWTTVQFATFTLNKRRTFFWLLFFGGTKKSDNPEHHIHFPIHYEQEHHDILNTISIKSNC